LCCCFQGKPAVASVTMESSSASKWNPRRAWTRMRRVHFSTELDAHTGTEDALATEWSALIGSEMIYLSACGLAKIAVANTNKHSLKGTVEMQTYDDEDDVF